ncbi:hypothetical protein DERP_007359 [Dermatophagoides pteronyssinus]|uniref:Uncharacterized protein n=1 Tax=Dermatophagoides pteronyssinus TaxID=6956 RepID=A0ABQ8J491_DERPT|nr:hypothetical protein DERP_007359 [Dermatophagoides pteronyssinus]
METFKFFNNHLFYKVLFLQKKKPTIVTPRTFFFFEYHSKREDDTTKEIKSTLGDFGKFLPFLTNSINNSDCINPNLVGISRNEFNRRRVQEIFAEMIPNNGLILPSKPITGLDDLYNENKSNIGSNKEKI